MSVDGDEVRRIADLAKLSLAEDEVDRLAEEMSRILDHARRLREVDGAVTDGSADEAFAGASPAGPDVSAVEPDPLLLPPEDVAPDMREGFFTVPPPPGVVHPGPEPPDANGGMADSRDGMDSQDGGAGSLNGAAARPDETAAPEDR